MCCHNPLNSNMDYRIFNVRIDVNACHCTWGCPDTNRESALKVDPGKKMPCPIGASNLYQRHDGEMLYQLSYIPIPLLHTSMSVYFGRGQEQKLTSNKPVWRAEIFKADFLAVNKSSNVLRFRCKNC